MRSRNLIVCFVLAASFASNALADDSGFYIGASVGSAEHAEEVVLTPSDVPPMVGESDSRDTSWALTLGYRVSRNLAFELGYLDLGDMEASVADPTGESDAQGRFTFSTEGVTVAMLGQFPIGKWTPYVKAGVLFSETELDFTGTLSGATFGDSVKGDSEDPFFGAGVTYDVGSRWKVRLDFTHVMDAGDPETGRSDYHNASLGLSWHF
jgi:opacity protein-like surface antigen